MADQHTPRSGANNIPGLDLIVACGLIAVAVIRDGLVVHTSPRLDEIFALPPGGATGKSLADLVTEADRERVAAALAFESAQPADDAPTRGPRRVTVIFDGLRSDGGVFDAEIVATPGDLADGPALIAIVTDITERRRAERQLSYMAYLDPLTSLPNRALFLDRLRETLATARRDARIFAVLMCDLDGFKKVNDTHGHEAGDVLLEVVARRLEGVMRDSDTVARLGGDEFAVVLPRVAHRDDVALIALRMVHALDAPIEIRGASCKVGISIGIATFPADGADMDTLLSRADAAMYESKKAGKNRHTYAAGELADPVRLPFVRWSEAHEVGVAQIDAQHRKLVDLVNQLGDDLKAGRERDRILTTLRALVTFTVKHFATEERLMAEHAGWPLETRHADEHKKLVEDVTSMTVNVDVASMTLTMRFLQEWLLRHIDTLDKPLGTWLSQHGMT